MVLERTCSRKINERKYWSELATSATLPGPGSFIRSGLFFIIHPTRALTIDPDLERLAEGARRAPRSDRAQRDRIVRRLAGKSK
jgi:hypothetical protein